MHGIPLNTCTRLLALYICREKDRSQAVQNWGRHCGQPSAYTGKVGMKAAATPASASTESLVRMADPSEGSRRATINGHQIWFAP